jgi:putative ABC transport system substrate-binding protein
LSAFREGLQKRGWIKVRDIRIDTRWGALDDAEVRQRSAKELLALQPDIILTQNTPPTASMLQQTRTVPIIFVVVADPVGSGLVGAAAVRAIVFRMKLEKRKQPILNSGSQT